METERAEEEETVPREEMLCQELLGENGQSLQLYHCIFPTDFKAPLCSP